MVTMLYEAGSLSTRHVSVRARIRFTGSWRRDRQQAQRSGIIRTNDSQKTDGNEYEGNKYTVGAETGTETVDSV